MGTREHRDNWKASYKILLTTCAVKKFGAHIYDFFGELGRYHIVLDVKIRILSFGSKLLLGKESKLSLIINRLCFEMYTVNDANFSL